MKKNVTALIVFARVPGSGDIKTRISRDHGPQTAERIYAELLNATAATVSGLEYRVAYCGAEDPGDLRKIFPGAVSYYAQKGPDLGARMKNAAFELFIHGIRSVVIVGSDCPAMTARDMQRAFVLLDKGADVVFGPAFDGGYYLVGLKPGRTDIFGIGDWGTRDVLDRSLTACRQRSFVYELLDTRRDIDTMEDYTAWKGRPR